MLVNALSNLIDKRPPASTNGYSIKSLWALSWQFHWQQTRSRVNLVQLLTLFILFFYLSFTTLLGNGVQGYLKQNLKQLLGADSVIQTFQPLNQAQRSALTQHSHELSETQTFNVMLTHQVADKHLAQLVRLKTIDDNYPVLGSLGVTEAQGLSTSEYTKGPSHGDIWLEPRLAAALLLKINDEINVAGQTFKFTHYLISEPDRLSEGHNSDMRAMVHLASLKKLIEADTLEAKYYRYLMAHDETQLQSLVSTSDGIDGATLISQTLGNHPLAKSWQRVEKFMGLVSVLLVILASIILALSNQNVIKPLQTFSAICIANGLAKQASKWLVIFGGLFTTVITLVPSVLLAMATTYLAVQWLENYQIVIALDLQWIALLEVIVIALSLYVALTLPAWYSVLITPVKRLLMSYQAPERKQWLTIMMPVIAIIALIVWYSDNWTLTIMVVGTLAVCLLGLVLLTWCVLGLGKWGLSKRAQLFGFALYLMQQRIYVKGAQIIALGLSLTLLLLSLRITQDVTNVLEQLTFKGQGNVVISQVTNTEQQALAQFLTQYQGQINHIAPFQYAQLTHINQVKLNETGLQPSESSARLERPIRLHWQAKVPSNNKVVLGSWQSDQVLKANQWPVSIESEVFEDMQFKLGDVLQMRMGEQSVELLVASKHDFVSGGSNTTFWFVRHSNDAVEDVETFYMGDAQLSDKALANLGQVWQAHPSMRMMSVDTKLADIRFYMNFLIKIVVIYSVFISLLTNLLLAAAISVHQKQDKARNGLLSVFGIDKTKQKLLIFYEWAIITLLPTLVATLCVYLSIASFYKYELDMPYQANFMAVLTQALVMATIIAITGIFMSFRQLKSPTRELLEEQ